MAILLLPLLVSGNVNYVHIAVIKLIFICNVIGMHVLEIGKSLLLLFASLMSSQRQIPSWLSQECSLEILLDLKRDKLSFTFLQV